VIVPFILQFTIVKRKLIHTITAFMLVSLAVKAQESFDGPLFQCMLIHNPAYSGGEGDGTARTLYMNHYPGNNYNLHSVYLSYDSYIPVLHGGAGFYIADEYLGGIINDIRAGFTYSYFIQAGRELFIHSGLSASVFHRGFNFGDAVFPDQIDPVAGVVFPSAENTGAGGKSAFDLGAGFLVNYRGNFGAFSVSHLTQPDISEAGLSVDRLKRKYNLEIAGRFSAGSSDKRFIRPLFLASYQDDYFSASAGAAFESNNLSVNSVLLWNNAQSLNLQCGFAVTISDLSLFYNYRFNISAEGSRLPLSLMHQTGLSFRLNKIEKRNNISTIIIPKL
jgi:type IX secretion system PorP/SprF family membrane protein